MDWVKVCLATFGVCPVCDALVELLEEFERSIRNLELANVVPCDKRVKQLLCGIVCRKIKRLEGRSVQTLREEGISVSSHRHQELCLQGSR
jgi:hypothetical protein